MSGIRLVIFLLIFSVMALGDALWWRWADRRLRPLRHATLLRTLLGVWMGWLLAYLLLACIWPQVIRRSQSPVPTPLHAAVYLWHILVLPVLGVLTLSAGAVSKVVAAIRWLRRGHRPTGAVTVPADTRTDGAVSAAVGVSSWSRRQFLGAAAVAAPPAITALVVGRALGQLHAPPRVRRMNIVLPQLPAHLDGLTIAHVTDMHVGKFTRPHMLPALADQVNRLRADYVCVTGDLIDMSLSDLPAAIDMLNRLDPRQGLLVCEGNHDLMESSRAFERQMRASGHVFLADEDYVTSFRGYPLQFLGTRWEGGDGGIRASFGRVRDLLQPDCFPILMAHHPHAFDPAVSAGIPLTLSGHTHGGQLMLTKHIGAGPLFFRYWSGLYRRDDSALVVSNGVGAWFPLRINAPAEIVHITLRSQQA